ncbi:hypothetical protein niasHS_008395 [Heterodera schachtii]|uniref:BTB domain-containing protein n=1 Tax=Heterodera schachtii TaxID=97005 RepID=A0ABD2JCE5_HETSC
MSKLLSTGAYGDLLLAHKAILWHASEEFASILCVDTQNSSDSNGKKSVETIKTVLVTDVPIEAFKVMLSFIYTEDLKGLTAQNLLDVLFAAKMYKIIGLINACVAFPVSQFSNVFEVIAEARILDIDFAQCCLQYIDENAHDLFLSENFLQIDNKFLTELLARDQLQTNGELEIWEAAIRWADAQCRRNGTECSAENRRTALGQALFEIRFPLIKKEDFTKTIEALFRFETSKMGDAAEKTPDQLIAITNLSISVFNLLLQFIYADDFNGLNGQNWAEVMKADLAKMYEINGLVEACVTFPISQLPNIFEAVDLASLLGLELFGYIDANVETLLRTNGFLQIDQQFLCELFVRENLQINGEILLWNAALRWADAQCRQKGTECSGENLHAVLGAAVNKIRLPLISKEIFTEDIAPSGVLTPEEVISIYQFHAHPELIGAPGGLPPLPFPAFPSREKAHRNNSGGKFRLEIGKFSEFARGPTGSERLGEHMFIRGIPLQILAKVSSGNYLGLFIKIKAPVGQGWQIQRRGWKLIP